MVRSGAVAYRGDPYREVHNNARRTGRLSYLKSLEMTDCMEEDKSSDAGSLIISTGLEKNPILSLLLSHQELCLPNF